MNYDLSSMVFLVFLSFLPAVAPGEEAAIGSAPRLLPFDFGGETLAEPRGIGFGVLGVHPHHRQGEVLGLEVVPARQLGPADEPPVV